MRPRLLFLLYVWCLCYTSGGHALSDYEHVIVQHNQKAGKGTVDISACNQEILSTVGGGRHGIRQRSATAVERRNLVCAVLDAILTSDDPENLFPSLLMGLKQDSPAFVLDHLAVLTILYGAALQPSEMDLKSRVARVEGFIESYYFTDAFSAKLKSFKGRIAEILAFLEFEPIYGRITDYRNQTPSQIIILNSKTLVDYHKPKVEVRKHESLPITTPLYKDLNPGLEKSFHQYQTDNPDYEEKAYNIYCQKLRPYQFDRKLPVFPFPEESNSNLRDQQGSLYKIGEDGFPTATRPLYETEEQTFLGILQLYQELEQNYNPQKSGTEYKQALTAFYSTQVFRERYVLQSPCNVHIGQLRNLYNLGVLDLDSNTVVVVDPSILQNNGWNWEKIEKTLTAKGVTIRFSSDLNSVFQNVEVFRKIMIVDPKLSHVLDIGCQMSEKNQEIFVFWLEPKELTETILQQELLNSFNQLFNPFPA